MTKNVVYPKLSLVWKLREYGIGVNGFLDFEKIGDKWVLFGDISVTDRFSSYNLFFKKEDLIDISGCLLSLKELEELDEEDIEDVDYWHIDKVLLIIADVIEDKVKADIAEIYNCKWTECDVDFSDFCANLKKYKVVNRG